MKKYLITIDIGSTYSKGALFLKGGSDSFEFLSRFETPTTTEDLTVCFYKVKEALLKERKEDIPTEVFYSSSAKGGLCVIAIGIVPELTLEMARLTAYSAGAKITKVYSYKLKKKDIEEIEKIKPDIILFSGGTDGGNETILLHNASLLKTIKKGPAIIYAGNNALADEMKEIFEGQNVFVSENILPELDRPNPEPTRELIREIFLKEITVSKGISKIIEKENKNPYPTPYSVYELMKILAEYPYDDKKFQFFSLVDMGGATTDFYSFAPNEIQEDNVMYKGITGPRVKRTVEGDLGMRINAQNVFLQAGDFLKPKRSEENWNKFSKYIEKISTSPELRPETLEEEKFDHDLAKVCLYLSLSRHAGFRRSVYTANGLTYLQQGKDLRKVDTLILTGGWMSRQKSKEVFSEEELFFEKQRKEGDIPLLPNIYHYLVDSDYLIPLISNFHESYPKESLKFIYGYLKEIL